MASKKINWGEVNIRLTQNAIDIRDKLNNDTATSAETDKFLFETKNILRKYWESVADYLHRVHDISYKDMHNYMDAGLLQSLDKFLPERGNWLSFASYITRRKLLNISNSAQIKNKKKYLLISLDAAPATLDDDDSINLYNILEDPSPCHVEVLARDEEKIDAKAELRKLFSGIVMSDLERDVFWLWLDSLSDFSGKGAPAYHIIADKLGVGWKQVDNALLRVRGKILLEYPTAKTFFHKSKRYSPRIDHVRYPKKQRHKRQRKRVF